MVQFKATMYNTVGQYPIIVHVQGEASDWIAFVKKARTHGKKLWPNVSINEIGVTMQDHKYVTLHV
jgi:hypothetical protein